MHSGNVGSMAEKGGNSVLWPDWKVWLTKLENEEGRKNVATAVLGPHVCFGKFTP